MEWEGADVILCGSEFVRAGIQSCGGPVERCSVAPYGVDFPIALSRRDFGRRKLRVITVGAVGLGKGTPLYPCGGEISQETGGIPDGRPYQYNQPRSRAAEPPR